MMKKFLPFLTLFIISNSWAQAQSTRIYVDQSATGTGDGSSWTNAATDLRNALTNSVTANTTELWIAEGTYKTSTSNTALSFDFGTPGLQVYGGFAGNETSVSQRNIKNNPTILSGDLSDNDNLSNTLDRLNGDRFDNTKKLVNINADSILFDGITVSGAHSTATSGLSSNGAGITIGRQVDQFTLRNCTFENNYTYSGGAGFSQIQDSDCSILVESCVFRNNVSRWGAAYYVYTNTNGVTLNLDVVNSLFANNKTSSNGRAGSGGRAYAFADSSTANVNLINNTYTNNLDAGTISATTHSTVTNSRGNGTSNFTLGVHNCVFWNNIGPSNSISLAFNKGKTSELLPNTTAVTNSLDEDNFSNITNKQNTLSTNPLFEASNDFRLKTGSPAVNSGDNSRLPSTLLNDLDGNTRIQNTTVDMGAYEGVDYARIYVDSSATGTGSGADWANAVTDLQTALQSRVRAITYEIWVAKGTYFADRSDKEVRFTLDKDNFRVYGGFSGTETSTASRNIQANPTILSGDLNNNDNHASTFTRTATDRADNTKKLLLIFGDTVLVDGLTISGGHSDITGGTTSNGAGVVLSNQVNEFKIRNCTIQNNFAHSGGAGLSFIPVRDGEVTVENCVFKNNVARWGASYYMYTDGNGITLSFTATNSLFVDNKTSSNGRSGSAGRIYTIANSSTANVNLINNTYTGNLDAGTISATTHSTVTNSRSSTSSTVNLGVYNCIFWNNKGPNNSISRALDIAKTTEFDPNTLVVNNSLDEDNFSNIVNKSNTTSSNPLFLGPNDFQLSAGSPALDAGDNSRILAGVTTDILGNNRISNTTVDMGAYERDITTSIGEHFLSNQKVHVYPNPAVNRIQVETELEIERFRLFTVTGRLVLEEKNKNNQLNIAQIPVGVYLLDMQTLEGESIRRKIVKQ